MCAGAAGVDARSVRALYRALLRYGSSLSLTEPAYFRRRVAAEFRRNRDLGDSGKIAFAYGGRHCYGVRPSCKMTMALSSTTLHTIISRWPMTILIALKHTIDYSRLPEVKENDLSEQFVRGSGPGGSAVNKNANCVVLTHNPTGIVIKCHVSRCLDENRKMARQMLVSKLDNIQNAEWSVAAQKNKILEKRFKSAEYKKRKMQKMKSEWMEREGIK